MCFLFSFFAVELWKLAMGQLGRNTRSRKMLELLSKFIPIFSLSCRCILF